jgi:hypothetical protein
MRSTNVGDPNRPKAFGRSDCEEWMAEHSHCDYFAYSVLLLLEVGFDAARLGRQQCLPICQAMSIFIRMARV